MKKKKVIFLMCIIIFIILCLVVFYKSNFTINIKQMFINKITENTYEYINNTTIIDITNLEAINIEHEHIYKTDYDENNHWEECKICGNKQNVKSHSLTTTWALGKESCHYTNSYTKVCSCGYSETGHKPCVWKGTYLRFLTLHTHGKTCSVCGTGIMYSYYLNSYGSGKIYNIEDFWNGSLINPRTPFREYCHRADGTRILCGETGKCTVCSQNYTTSDTHYLLGNYPEKEGHLICDGCGKDYGTFTYETTLDSNTPATNTITLNFKLLNGATFSRTSTEFLNQTPANWSSKSQSASNISSDRTEFTLTVVAKASSINKIKFLDLIKTVIKIDGKDFIFSTGQYIQCYPEKIEPTISNINVSSNSNTNWEKTKTITISGTENWSNTVSIKILDDKEKIVYIGEAKVTNNNYSISCTPDIEADDIGKTFKVIVTDGSDNSVEKNFTISKIDSVPPSYISDNNVNEEWAKSKELTFKATDSGIGNVSIAFNDISDLKNAILVDDIYLRNYKFIGDVYSEKQLTVLYKDELGNTSIQKISINKIDNTAPNITSVSIHNNKLKVYSNDIKEGMGEGSGITKYRYISSIKRLDNPDISNGTEININEEFIITDICNTKYVYIVAEDLVREHK